ncbi:hypothetical protein ACKVV7_009847 [Pyricularia oryzae]
MTTALLKSQHQGNQLAPTITYTTARALPTFTRYLDDLSSNLRLFPISLVHDPAPQSSTNFACHGRPLQLSITPACDSSPYLHEHICPRHIPGAFGQQKRRAWLTCCRTQVHGHILEVCESRGTVKPVHQYMLFRYGDL